MLKAIIRAEDFAYLTRFCSNEETRYYLAGVFVDVANGRLAATDGHRLGVLKPLPAEMHVAKGAESVILANNKPLLQACKPARNTVRWLRIYADRLEVIELSANMAGDAADFVDYAGPAVMTFPASSVYIDGMFPDYVCVIPRETEGAATAVGANAAYVATFAGPDKKDPGIAMAFASAKYPAESPLVIANTDPRFLGVLMPMRVGRDGMDPAARLADIMGFEPDQKAQAEAA